MLTESAHTLTKRWNQALALAIATIVFNVVEGLVSIYFGIKDETLTLFGFGMDSFIETISATGVAVMIIRIKNNEYAGKTRFEIVALRITGWSFYGLSVVLAAGAVVNAVQGNKPESTLAGIIISVISIISMVFLVYAKKKTGRILGSKPIIADANCNLVCIYMSIVLLVASAAYAVFQVGFIDILGTAGIIYFSVREGREALASAKGMSCSCEDDC